MALALLFTTIVIEEVRSFTLETDPVVFIVSSAILDDLEANVHFEGQIEVAFQTFVGNREKLLQIGRRIITK